MGEKRGGVEQWCMWSTSHGTARGEPDNVTDRVIWRMETYGWSETSRSRTNLTVRSPNGGGVSSITGTRSHGRE